MKKCLLLCMALALAGCQRVGQNPQTADPAAEEPTSSVKHTLLCTLDEDEYEFDAQGDKILTSKMTVVSSLESLGADEDTDKELLQEAVEQSLSASYGSMAGVEADWSLQDGHVLITLRIDYDKADLNDLIDAGLLQAGEMESQYTSLDKTQNDLEAAGFACTVK